MARFTYPRKKLKMRPKLDFRIEKTRKKGANFIMFLLISLGAGGEESQAKDLGTYGATFEIVEDNFLTRIQERLANLEKSGKMKDHQQELIKRVKESVLKPTSVEGLKIVTEYGVKEYDPTFILDKDIKDHEGNLIGGKGTHYNPLDYMSFGTPLLFIDGDNDQQMNWSLSQEGKIVLVKGSPISLETKHQRQFYFDQGGSIVSKLGIDQIPAKVFQEGKKLKIEFVKLSDK